jgi:uncharacterized protein YneF (UPF0154 family)
MKLPIGILILVVMIVAVFFLGIWLEKRVHSKKRNYKQ